MFVPSSITSLNTNINYHLYLTHIGNLGLRLEPKFSLELASSSSLTTTWGQLLLDIHKS